MDEISTTRTLVEQAQEGDRVALNELCDRYLSRVLSVVRIRLGPSLRGKVESWDIVQEVMIDALKELDSFDFRTEGAFLKLLSKIVENRIRDEADRWAAQKRRLDRESPLDKARSDQSANPLELSGSVPTPSQVVGLAEDLARLEAAIEQLPADYRELIIALKLEGRNYQEIAEETGKSADAVRMQTNRALVALNKAFREADAGNEVSR